MTLASCLSSGGLARNSALDTAARLTTSRSLESTSISPESWPSEAWWTTFGDHQLDELERRALSGQPSLRLAAARVRQAEALVGVAGANRFPQVGASLKSTRQRYSANSTVPKPLAGSRDVFSDLSLGELRNRLLGEEPGNV
nr:TolC family protein [Cupriavidus necator]